MDPVDLKALTRDLEKLLASIVQTADLTSDLSVRRTLLIEQLGKLLDADAGFWSWGRGDHEADTVVALAIIDYQFDEKMKLHTLQFGMGPEVREAHRSFGRFFDERRQLCVTRKDAFDDAEWVDGCGYRDFLRKMGMDSFIQTVRYSTEDSWSNFFFMRKLGQPEFGVRERTIAGMAMSSISWLHATSAQLATASATAKLTPRERTMILMLLDGHSRKQIASRLDLSEHTVNDYIKSMYRQLGVHSLSELAARLLKNAASDSHLDKGDG